MRHLWPLHDVFADQVHGRHEQGLSQESKINDVPFPDYLGEWQESASPVLTVCLALMLAMELILRCWGMNVEEEGLFEDGNNENIDGSHVSQLRPPQ